MYSLSAGPAYGLDMMGQEPFERPTRRTRLVDAAVAVAVFVLAFGQLLLDPALSPQMPAAIVGVGLSVSLFRRSTRPHLAVAGQLGQVQSADTKGNSSAQGEVELRSRLRFLGGQPLRRSPVRRSSFTASAPQFEWGPRGQ